MGRLFSRRKYRDLILGLALLCAVLALMRWPQESMAAARDGLALCGNVIIPSLFPFFVLSSLVVELGMSRYLGRLLEPPLSRAGVCHRMKRLTGLAEEISKKNREANA